MKKEGYSYKMEAFPQKNGSWFKTTILKNSERNHCENNGYQVGYHSNDIIKYLWNGLEAWIKKYRHQNLKEKTGQKSRIFFLII